MRLIFIPLIDCSLVVTHDTYRPESCSAILNCVKRNVPVLILSDGILEYRNSWVQSHSVASGIFNPVLGHKLACIGASQVRFLESIKGNFGKCENVGLPRLDDFKIESSKSNIPSILVCSSKTPWFSYAIKLEVLQSFIDLKEIAFNYGKNNNVKFNWRISDHIASVIGVEKPAFANLLKKIYKVRLLLFLCHRPSCLNQCMQQCLFPCLIIP